MDNGVKKNQSLSVNVIIVGVALVVTLIAIYALYPYYGSLYQDEQGFYRGNGVAEYKYKNQNCVERKDTYFLGRLSHSIWFHPDGRVLYETNWSLWGNGTGYYLYDDGSLKSEVEFQSGVAEGTGKVYDRSGNLIKIQTYKDGSIVSEELVADAGE